MKTEPKSKKHIHVMDLILVIIAAALLVFTVKMIQIFEQFGSVPDTLIACVFAALTGECGAMAWIKTAKERNKERVWELNDRKHVEMREDEQKETEGQNNGT